MLDYDDDIGFTTRINLMLGINNINDDRYLKKNAKEKDQTRQIAMMSTYTVVNTFLSNIGDISS
jgi:hypothetical protein